MVYAITKHIIGLLLKPFIGSYQGIENIPQSGAILAANHASYIDHFIIAQPIFKKLRRILYFLAMKEHFDTFMQRQWHKYLKAIPLDRQSDGSDALGKAVDHLKKGDLIMIYPEGTRTLTGKMNRAKTGVARLALAAKVPVVPIGLTNTFYILPKGKWIPGFGKKADVTIGKPLYFNKYYGKAEDKNTIRKVTTIIMNEIAKLSGQKYVFDQEYLK